MYLIATRSRDPDNTEPEGPPAKRTDKAEKSAAVAAQHQAAAPSVLTAIGSADRSMCDGLQRAPGAGSTIGERSCGATPRRDLSTPVSCHAECRFETQIGRPQINDRLPPGHQGGSPGASCHAIWNSRSVKGRAPDRQILEQDSRLAYRRSMAARCGKSAPPASVPRSAASVRPARAARAGVVAAPSIPRQAVSPRGHPNCGRARFDRRCCE